MATSTLEKALATPTPQTINEAQRLLSHIGVGNDLSVKIEISGQKAEELSPALRDALIATLNLISRGQRVEVRGVPEDLTTTVAARRIGVSRPTLMKLIREGALPAHKVGSHFRVRTEDADAYRVELLRQKTAQQAKAFEELRALEEELGLAKEL